MDILIKRELNLMKINPDDVNIAYIVIIVGILLNEITLKGKSATQIIRQAIKFYVWIQESKIYNK